MLSILRNQAQNTEYRVKYAQSHVALRQSKDVDPLVRRQGFIVEVEQSWILWSVFSETGNWKIKKGSF